MTRHSTCLHHAQAAPRALIATMVLQPATPAPDNNSSDVVL